MESMLPKIIKIIITIIIAILVFFFFISRSNFLIYESKTTLCLRRTGILGMYEWLVHNTFNIIRRNPNPKPSAHISPLVSETETAFTFVF